MYSCGALYRDEHVLDDQLERIYKKSLQIRNVAWKTRRKRWTKETSGERGPGKSVLVARLGVRVFANGPGDLGSIPGRVIPKTQKMVLDASLLNTQHYKVRIKGKVEQSREGVAPSPTHWCGSYRKGSLRVTLDYGRQLYLLMMDENIVTYKFIKKLYTSVNLNWFWF